MRMFLLIFTIFNIPIEKLKARDPEVFEQLFKEFNIVVFNFLLVKTRNNHAVAEDVLSETFLSAFKSAPRIKSVGNIQGWLIRIAFRRLNDYLNKEYKQREKIEKLKNKQLQNEVDNDEEANINDRKIVLFKQALANLKQEYQQAIELKYVRKKSVAEMAVIMQAKDSLIQGLLYRARKALKKEMKHLVKLYI